MKINRLSLITGIGVMTISATSIADNYGAAQGTALYDKVFYQIGGGSAVMPSPSRKRPHELSLGIGWNANLMCGNFDIKTTVKNQLNGITEGFKDLMGNIIQSATGAVASMPAMIIQRANPQLYDILTNGVLQGRLDFDNLKTSCEALSNKAADYMADSGWNMMAKSQNYHNIGQQEPDVIKAKKQMEKEDGKNGILWIGGKTQGGQNQEPIHVLGSILSAGFNMSNGKPVTNTSAIPDCDGSLCTTWISPQEVADWGTRVLGESIKTTCTVCGTSSSKPGVGLAPLIEEEYIAVLNEFQRVLNTKNPTVQDLRAISSTQMPVTRGLLEALKEDPDVRLLAPRLASEVAVSRILEQALLLRRTMLTGMKEPNVANNKEALDEMEKNLTALDREIEQTEMEMRLQRQITGNTALATLEKRAVDRQKSLQNNSSEDNETRAKKLSGSVDDAQSDNRNEGNFQIDNPQINLPIPDKSGLNKLNGIWGPGNHGQDSGSGSGGGNRANLKKYESKDAYADGRATVYRTPDGKLVRREGGSLAWRNNNPGNIRAGAFAKAHGAIGVGPGGFAIFPDAETGARAIGALMRTKNYKNLSIADAIARYAPPSENNTAAYQAAIRKQTGLDSSRKMGTLSDAELNRVVNAIRQHEGWQEGKISTQ
ncbi:integrating conjugative element protein [Aggregatibacter actinomycetemcomitans]|uniref:integrating conjugative element protein n=2 Tax=Aggregatibacter actinomycetemcomitans TaxID=714 RepID=UPI000240040A|nr:integrating conjugative element protein [Aggregatibacter actinomycetemcomitans]EHK90260.1 integrating conjugative element protein [Aggregatibacter actinomycetemcomitans RhAA1]KNE77328.1 conjugal transfer protein [Aggregatibacter actinomycetemcomitans RhAA1]